jgi:hypothetical protein
MALGRASQQLDLLDPVTRFCDEALPTNSIFGFLHEHRETLFPDQLFTDLFAAVGRRSVPPSVVTAVMVLQRLEGLSDREAVDRFTFDARWRYAAGWVAGTVPAGPGSRTRCWSICGNGCAAPSGRTGSSRWPSPPPGLTG